MPRRRCLNGGEFTRGILPLKVTLVRTRLLSSSACDTGRGWRSCACRRRQDRSISARTAPDSCGTTRTAASKDFAGRSGTRFSRFM